MIYDVSELRVYKRSVRGLDLVYQLAEQLPSLHFRLRRQITSAAEGVPAHIAEGFAKRRYPAEFKRYLFIGLGSSDEVIAHARSIWILAKRVKQIDKDLCIRVGKEYKIISKQINSTITKWVQR